DGPLDADLIVLGRQLSTSLRSLGRFGVSAGFPRVPPTPIAPAPGRRAFHSRVGPSQIAPSQLGPRSGDRTHPPGGLAGGRKSAATTNCPLATSSDCVLTATSPRSVSCA